MTRMHLRTATSMGGLLFALTLLPSITGFAASPLDQLTELTGKASAVVTLKNEDNLASEFRYNVSVRNHSPDPLIADSLIIVLDKISNLGKLSNLAGADRETVTNETLLSHFDVLGQDGLTDDGKPYFRIPVGAAPDLGAQTESLPATVRIRYKDYFSVFIPTFRVYGGTRPPAEPKQQPIAQPPPSQPLSQTETQMDKLIQLLLKKGVITEEEWRKANQP